MRNVLYQKPIGFIMEPYRHDQTGDYSLQIIVMRGLRENSDRAIIHVFSQYLGLPMMTIVAQKGTS